MPTRKTLPLLSFLLAIAPAVFGQETTATILGTIKDQSGLILPGVTITITNLDTGLSRTVVSNDEGRYNVPHLGLGRYEVRASLAGFKEFVRSGITLVVGQNAVINIVMQVGEVVEQVTVTGETPLVETASPQLARLVSSTQMRELPLNGRSFDQLGLLQPGVQAFRHVTVTANTSFSTRISVSGARIDANNLMLDGIEINDWARSGGGSAAGLFLGVDAVQEFKVLTHNYSAEYGRSAGAVFNIVTRSGTNAFHGTVYEFLRNDRLDARNFFDVEKSSLRRNQFGGYLSGPIVRDRAFFAVNYEGFRERRGRTLTNFVLTPEARQGILPSGRIAVSPAVVPYLSPNVMPLPNAEILPGGVVGTHKFLFKKPTREDFGMLRLDYKISDSDSVFARYTLSESASTDLDVRSPSKFFSAGHHFRDQSGVLEHSHIFNSSLLNVLRLGFKRSTPQSLPEADPAFPQEQLTFIPGRPFGRIEFTTAANVFGAAAASVLSPFGQASLTPGHWFQTGYQVNNHLSYTRSKHAIKVGVEYELLRDWVNNGSVIGGDFTFTSIEDFLLARPSRFRAPLPTQDVSRDIVQHLFGWYVMDDFRLASGLTLNFGLRHEFVTSPRDRRPGHTAAIIDPLRDSDATLTDLFFHTSKRNFAPRIGLAWDVFGDGKTSLRSGFGLYHNQWIGRDFGIRMQFAPEFRGSLTIQPPARQPVFPNEYLVQQSLGFPVISTRPAGDNVQFLGLQTPTMLHYSLEIQRELFSNAMLSIGYIGSRGYHLMSKVEVNTRLPAFLPDGRVFFDRRAPLLNPRLNPLQEVRSGADSWYNSLQAEFRMRPTYGLELQVNYVLGKNIDNLSSNAGADSRGTPTQFMNSYDPDADKSLSALDVRHIFTLNYLYDLPSPAAQGLLRHLAGGWSLGGIITVASGNPFTALVGFCRSNSTVNCGTDRPDLAPGASNNPVLGDPNRYFDFAAFTLPEAGFFGNLGRNTIIGPGFANFDFSIFKKFRLSEGKTLQFRAEIFNVFNRANFALPGANLFTSSGERQANAGVITSTVSTSREIQFGLKFNF